MRTTLSKFEGSNPSFNVYNIKQLIPQLYSLFGNAVRDYKSAQVFVEAINTVLEDPQLFPDDDDSFVKLVRQTMFTFLEDYTRLVILKAGERVRVKTKDLLLETAIFPETQEGTAYSYSVESFHLPDQAIQIGKNSGRLKVQAFSNNLFFHWGNQRQGIDQNQTEQSNDTRLDFNAPWRIFSVEFNDAEIANLTIPVSYSFVLNESLEDRWICAYWDIEGMQSVIY